MSDYILRASTPSSDIVLWNSQPFPPSYSRAGNYLASQLREIHDDSHSVLPASVYHDPTSKRQRWTSMYSSSYIPLTQATYEQHVSENQPEVAAARSVSGLYRQCLLKDTDQMFMTWKVPERLTSSESSRRGSPADIEIPKPGNIKLQQTTLPDTFAKTPSVARSSVTRSNSCRLDADWKNARTIPSIIPGTAAPKTPRSLGIAGPRPVEYSAPVYNSDTKVGHHSKTFRTQQVLRDLVNRPEDIIVTQYFKDCSDLEKKTITKALRLMDGRQQEGELETLRTVQHWLHHSQQKEREAALDFFQKVADSKTNNSDISDEQKERIQQILVLLNSYDSSGLNIVGSAAGRNEKRQLQHLRLLTPHTRANRYLHQTWHHLPGHSGLDPTANPSAVYQITARVPHRHWNIHPDWPLSSRAGLY